MTHSSLPNDKPLLKRVSICSGNDPTGGRTNIYFVLRGANLYMEVKINLFFFLIKGIHIQLMSFLSNLSNLNSSIETSTETQNLLVISCVTSANLHFNGNRYYYADSRQTSLIKHMQTWRVYYKFCRTSACRPG